MFDLELIENFYNNLDSKIDSVRKLVDKPLTLTEKIL